MLQLLIIFMTNYLCCVGGIGDNPDNYFQGSTIAPWDDGEHVLVDRIIPLHNVSMRFCVGFGSVCDGESSIYHCCTMGFTTFGINNYLDPPL